MSYLDTLFSLKGKVALITGGGRGIGQVVAIGLAKAGAEVAIVSRTGADETVKKIEEEGGKSYSLIADVTDEKAVDDALKEVFARSGGLHIVFNNAGICIHKETLEGSIAEWKDVLNINLTGEYIVARAAGRLMIEKCIKGSLVFTKAGAELCAPSSPLAIAA